jgi:hypothetical protein
MGLAWPNGISSIEKSVQTHSNGIINPGKGVATELALGLSGVEMNNRSNGNSLSPPVLIIA